MNDEGQNRKLSVYFTLGIVLIFISAAIFVTTNWAHMTIFLKLSLLGCVTFMNFGISTVFSKFKMKFSASAFYTLGCIFIPILYIAIVYYKVFGEWFAFDGDGAYLVWSIFLCSCSLAVFLVTCKMKSKFAAYISLFLLTTAYCFLNSALHPYVFILLGNVVSLLILFNRVFFVKHLSEVFENIPINFAVFNLIILNLMSFIFYKHEHFLVFLTVSILDSFYLIHLSRTKGLTLVFHDTAFVFISSLVLGVKFSLMPWFANYCFPSDATAITVGSVLLLLMLGFMFLPKIQNTSLALVFYGLCSLGFIASHPRFTLLCYLIISAFLIYQIYLGKEETLCSVFLIILSVINSLLLCYILEAFAWFFFIFALFNIAFTVYFCKKDFTSLSFVTAFISSVSMQSFILFSLKPAFELIGITVSSVFRDTGHLLGLSVFVVFCCVILGLFLRRFDSSVSRAVLWSSVFDYILIFAYTGFSDIFKSSGCHSCFIFGLVGAFYFWILDHYDDECDIDLSALIPYFLCFSLVFQDFVSIPSAFRFDYTICCSFLIYVYKVLVDKDTDIFNALFYHLLVYVAYLAISLFGSNRLSHALILGFVALFVLVIANYHKYLNWLLLGSFSMVYLLLYATRGFWTSIAWWLYLLFAGIFLVSYAALNEYVQRAGKADSLKEYVVELLNLDSFH